MITISLKIDERLKERLEEARKRHRQSQSDFIRQAIEHELARVEEGSTVAQRLGKLAGCFSGPENLSTDTRHLEGYGE